MMRIKVMSVIAAMLLTAGVGYAGYKSAAEVELEFDEVNNVTGAFGNLSDAFNSADDVQFIGCGGSNTFGFCHATPAAGDSIALCFTNDQELIKHIHAITPNSFVRFTLDPANGECLTVRVSTQSFYAPKIPATANAKAKDQAQ